jgi:uncharacterized protein YndB with AHSA1/START domain
MKKAPSLKVTTPSDREIEITREFDAPRQKVFDAFTKPDLVRRWLLGPPGWTMPVCEIDLREGGAFRYVWRHPDKPEMGMGGVYNEIKPPERIVHTEKFDESWYPGQAVITTVFTEKAGRTMVTMTIRHESKKARDIALKTDMAAGMAAGYARLDEILSKS